MCDISPVKIDINADLTKPAEDITEMTKDTHKGFGKILYAAYGPLVEKRIGEAKRIEAQAERDASEIKDGISRYDIAAKKMISLPEVSSIDMLCREIVNVDSVLKAKRLAAAIFTAGVEIKQIPEENISSDPINQTFFNHWRAEAELIDDDDLRQWWAHLLVEETKKPHSISPRTLEVAKKLSREEAQLFEKLNIGISEGFLLTNAEDEPATGTFSDILTLQDAELINPQKAERQCKKAENSNNIIFFIRTGYVLKIVSKYDIVLTGHRLTRAGKDLYDIMPPKKITLSDMIKVASIISKCNHTSSVSLHEIENISIDGETQTITYSDTPVWINKNISEGNLK